MKLREELEERAQAFVTKGQGGAWAHLINKEGLERLLKYNSKWQLCAELVLVAKEVLDDADANN